jgi:hypothetical protein
MKKTAAFLVTIIFLIFLFISCASSPFSQVFDENKPEDLQYDTKSKYLEISTAYTLESLLIPVIQMNELAMSLDYFNQFIDYNDYIFPDYLFMVIGMETGNYESGTGTVLADKGIYDNSRFSMEKALLSEDEAGNIWWQIHINSYGKEVFLEVQVNSYHIPLKIRYIDKKTDIKHEVIPEMASSFERALTEIPIEQLSASIKDRIQQEIKSSSSNIFTNPSIIKEEIIETSGGKFMTVRVRDLLSENQYVDYWLSPDVPGGMVKILYTDANGTVVSDIELTEIKKYITPRIENDEVISLGSDGSYNNSYSNSEPAYSEGSIENPILIYPEEIYYGSVGDEDISYYKFNVDRRSDLFIEVEGSEGIAELFYFGNDIEYFDWSTSSQGNSLNIEDYMIDGNSTVYFSVNDIADEYSVGEHYSINVYQNYILDSIGIMMNGEIYQLAEELQSGKKHTLTVGPEGLDYYKTTVKKGDKLIITILNEPDFGSLVWYDTENGSYSGMYSEWDSDSKVITIEGLKPGTICYYYFSFDLGLLDPLQKLELKISEIP